jgi:integrase
MSIRKRQWKDKDGTVQEAWGIDVKMQLPGRGIVRVRQSSPLNTKRGAEQYEHQVRQSLLDGSYFKDEEVQPTAKQVMTLRDFIPRFLTDAENNNKPSTVNAKKVALEVHLLPVFGAMPLDRIGLKEIEEFKAAMRAKVALTAGTKASPSRWALKKRRGLPKKFLSPKTINNALATLRRLLVLAQEHGELEHLPRVKLFKTERPAFDFLDFDEADRLVAAADPEWRALLVVALKTGLRQGELMGLQWSDLDLVRGKLHVRRSIWRGREGLPKGGRSRIVDMPGSVVEALKQHRHLKGLWVFCGEDGALLTPGKLKWPLERALRRSNVSRPESHISWHDLRHTYGSHLAMKGVALKVIQELMGHATIDMTMRYAHLMPAVKQTAVQVLDQPASAPAAASSASSQGHMGGT